MTAQGSPRAIFERAIGSGNLMVAEVILRTEIPRPTLVDLLELTALIARKDPSRHDRVATRWLVRYLEARQDATIDEAALAATALERLGSGLHDQALAALRDMAEAASSRHASTGVR